MSSSLSRLDPASLRSLAAAFRSGPLVHGFSRAAIAQIVGHLADQTEGELRRFLAAGFAPAQLALLLDELAEASAATARPSEATRLVLSGPPVDGVPTGDTGAVYRALVDSASESILLVGYKLHDSRGVFEPLAAKMESTPGLRVRLCLEIDRTPNDSSLDSEIVRRFAFDFRKKHWPWTRLPELYYDPRSLATDRTQRSAMHAKCLVVDRREALVTSANFTAAAQDRNIEVGAHLRDAALAGRLADYFAALILGGQLRGCRLE